MGTILIFAGGDSPHEKLAEELPEARLIIAADSGYDIAVAAGFTVDVLVGDMDSITTESIPDHVVVERHSPDKDATDLELALERAVAQDPQRLVVVGGAGGRFDHEVAAAGLLCSPRWEMVDEIDWITDRGWSHVITSRRILHGDVGALISLIPMGGAAHGVHTRGLRWDLKGATLAPGTTWGVSNQFKSPIADIRLDDGCLLAVIPAI